MCLPWPGPCGLGPVVLQKRAFPHEDGDIEGSKPYSFPQALTPLLPFLDLWRHLQPLDHSWAPEGYLVLF